MPTAELILQQFREQLYQHFDKRADMLMELVDALGSPLRYSPPAEYSLASCFRRGYSEMYKGIAAYAAQPDWLGLTTPPPQTRRFWLFGVDSSPHPRPYAATLSDRGLVYAPNPAPGNRPIVVGHQYSLVAYLPETEPAGSASWVLPAVKRVSSEADKELTGIQQLKALLTAPNLPWHTQLLVVVGDSSYSQPACLVERRTCPDAVLIARVRGNRVFYLPPEALAGQRGHPAWYGARFDLADPNTWPTPAAQVSLFQTGASGQTYRVDIQAWHNLRMRGQRGCLRHQHPFTLLRIVVYDAEGQPVWHHPLWLLVARTRRAEIRPSEAYLAYRQHPRLAHYFCFTKQHLTLVGFQTPPTEQEEAWGRIVQWASLQLWLARMLAPSLGALSAPHPAPPGHAHAGAMGLWPHYAAVGYPGTAAPTL